MDKKALAALKGSIKKWEKIVAGNGSDCGTDNCPLCLLFNNWDDWVDNSYIQCAGCPVAEKSKLSSCHGTPYEDWSDAGFYVLPHPDDKEYPKAKKLATAELNFLKSLLPKETKRASTATTTKPASKQKSADRKRAVGNRGKRGAGVKAKRPK